MASLRGRLIKDWGCSMSPQGSASIWIFIELTPAFLATVYKRMPIGFYLVASNKPLCLTCIQTTLHDTPIVISALPLKQPWNSLNCPNSFLAVCSNCRAWKTPYQITVFLWQLFWFYISRIEIETCWLYLLSCMHYDCLFILYSEISDLLQGDKIVLGNPSTFIKL